MAKIMKDKKEKIKSMKQTKEAQAIHSDKVEKRQNILENQEKVSGVDKVDDENKNILGPDFEIDCDWLL